MERLNRVQAPSDWAAAGRLGHLLADFARDFDQRTQRKCHDRGHPKVRCVHAALIGHMGGDALRLSDLAARAGVSQQAVGKLVRQLELIGYLESRVATDDRRARQVMLTERGRSLRDEFESIVEAVRADYSELLGVNTVALLEETLQDTLQKLQKG